MNKNTGDGELYTDVRDALAQDIFNSNYKYNNLGLSIDTAFIKSKEEADQILQNLIAQEANKAQQQLLQELMEELPKRVAITEAPDEYARQSAMGRNGTITEVELVIQNKLEGLS